MSHYNDLSDTSIKPWMNIGCNAINCNSIVTDSLITDSLSSQNLIVLATLTANQSVTADNTTINFNNIELARGYTVGQLANGIFTANVAGFYRFTVSVTYEVTSGTPPFVSNVLCVGAAQTQANSLATALNQPVSVAAEVVIFMDVGQQANFRYGQNGTFNPTTLLYQTSVLYQTYLIIEQL